MSQFLNRYLKRANPIVTKSSNIGGLYQLQRQNLTTNFNPKKNLTYVVGIDGTKYGYLALEHAFGLAKSSDKVVGLYIPVDLYQFQGMYEQPLFSSTMTITQEQKDIFSKKSEEIVSNIENKVKSVIEECNESNSSFNFMVYDDSVSVKSDLVKASEELKCDYLVVGSRGHSHSIKESIKQHVVDILGSVPDYCVHKASCSVIVVKPED